TDGSLDFRFSLLDPDSYTMKLQWLSNEDVASFYLPGTPEESEALALEVGPGSPALFDLDLTGSYSRIGGTVTGSWQEIGDNAAVVELYNESGRRIARTYCAEDGAFLFHSLVDQRVRLLVDIGWNRRWIGGEDFDAARPFDLQAGNDILNLEWVESGVQVNLSGPGNNLDYDYLLELWNQAGQLVYSENYIYGNEATFSNLEPGQYFLKVDGQYFNAVWAPQWYGGTENPEEAQLIDLAEGAAVQLDFALELGGHIKGRLGFGDGTFPGFFRVYLIQEDGTATTHNPQQQDGVFSFRGLADGEYFLSVDLGSAGAWWYPGTWDQGGAEALAVEDHSSHLDLTWNLPQMAKEVTP
nr:hypothetical protein [Candidatus Krumholzibacteria bacterium]